MDDVALRQAVIAEEQDQSFPHVVVTRIADEAHVAGPRRGDAGAPGLAAVVEGIAVDHVALHQDIRGVGQRVVGAQGNAGVLAIVDRIVEDLQMRAAPRLDARAVRVLQRETFKVDVLAGNRDQVLVRLCRRVAAVYDRRLAGISREGNRRGCGSRAGQILHAGRQVQPPAREHGVPGIGHGRGMGQAGKRLQDGSRVGV